MKNESCKYRMIPHNRQVELYNKSLHRWERQTERNGTTYKKTHMDRNDVVMMDVCTLEFLRSYCLKIVSILICFTCKMKSQRG